MLDLECLALQHCHDLNRLSGSVNSALLVLLPQSKYFPWQDALGLAQIKQFKVLNSLSQTARL